MSKIFLLGFLLVGFYGFGQSKSYEIKHSKKLIGQVIASKNDIYGDQYICSKHIRGIREGQFTYNISIYLGDKEPPLRDLGYFIQFDLKEKKVRWDDEYDFKAYERYLFSDSSIFFSEFYNSWKVHYDSGKKELWKKKFKITYFSEKLKVALGIYNRNSFSYLKLKCFNLDNGEELWSEELIGQLGWNQFLSINDTIGILVNKGIIKLNLKTGRLWQNKDIITIRDQDFPNYSVNPGNSGNSDIHLDPRYISYQKGYVFVDSSFVFVIKGNELACISMDSGKTIWRKKDLPFYGDLQIRQNENQIYFLQKDFQQKLQHKSRFFAINKSDGEVLKKIKFPKLKIDFKIIDDKIYFLGLSEIERYSFIDFQKEKEIDFSEKNVGNALFLLNEMEAIEGVNYVESIPLVDKDIKFFNDKNQVFSVDTNLTDIKNIETAYIVDISDKFKLVLGNEVLYLYDLENKRLAEFKYFGNAFFYGDLLIQLEDKTFTVVDLSKLDLY